MPSAILHFGSEEKQANYLKEDILDKVSSPKASLIQALADRYVNLILSLNAHTYNFILIL